MNKWIKTIFPLILVLAMTAFYAGSIQAADYDSRVAALEARQAELDAELAKPSPNSGRIQSLSREIGELNGQILADEAANRRAYQGQTYQDVPRRGNYYGHHHGSGHHGGCW